MPFIEIQPMPERARSMVKNQREQMRIGRTNRQIGGKTIVVFPGDDIQKAINTLNVAGGGTVILRDGTHFPKTSITLYNNIALEGETLNTTIDFGSNARQIIINGSNNYSTGTVSVSNGGSTVTGVGTTWTSAMVGRKILLNGIWYNISVFNSTTSLTITPYSGIAISGGTYMIATTIALVRVSNLIITNATVPAIVMNYGFQNYIEGVEVQKGATIAKGMTIDYSSNITVNDFRAKSVTNGIDITDSHFVNINDFQLITATTATGIDLQRCTNCFIVNSSINDSATFGLTIRDSSNNILVIGNTFNENTDGVAFGTNSYNIIFIGNTVKSNSTGGLVFYANVSKCIVSGNVFSDNTGNGVGIGATSSDNIVTGNYFSGNTNASITDTGVGNNVFNNAGEIIPTQDIRHFRMQNNSGAQRVAGDVVIFDAVAAGNGFTTTTTQGHDRVFGVVAETIENASFGKVQTLGKVTTMKVNGTTAIAIGDMLGTFTTAGIAMKASAGDMCFAIALEAYAVADSNGVIDALLITPRLI